MTNHPKQARRTDAARDIQTPAALSPRPFGLFDIPARAQLAAAITLRATASLYSNPAHYPDQELCNRANALARECENGRPTFCYSPHTPDDYRQAALYLTARHPSPASPVAMHG